MANLLSTIITGGSGTTPTLSLSRNIATPSNYYNGLQLEVKATSGTAGIALHRNGYSHVGIYHDSANELKFNMNAGTPILLATTGTIWGSGNDGSNSGLDADLLDGQHGSYYQPSSSAITTSNWSSYAAPKAYITESYVEFTIDGDANTYYPVTIHNWNGSFSWQRYSIHRAYSDTAPWDPIGTGSHKGGLTFAFEWAGDIAWGGNDKSIRVIEFNETYTQMVAGLQLAHCEGVVVWLRGGGAYYRLHGPGGRSQSYTINMSTWTSCAGVQYEPRSYDGTRVNNEINSRYPIRSSGNGDVFVNNQAVIHSGNISSQSVSYASSAGSVSWTNVSGRPTNVSSFTNDSGYVTSSGSVNYATSSGYADEAKWISYPDGPRDLSDRSPSWNNRSVAWDFVGAGSANGTGNYGGVMTFVPWDGTSGSTGDSSYQLAFGNASGVNASGQPKLSIRNGINSTWNSWYTLIHSGNISSQSVGSLQGYSASALLQQSRGTHSGSDFTSGTLVTTDINASEWAGDSFIMEVSGKSYDGNNSPFKLIMQGYLYANTIINVSAMSYGSYFPAPVKVMNLDGNLAFWWPRGSYWNSFEVHVREAGGSGWNRVTGIDNSVDPPSATKKVSCTPIQVLHTNNAGYAYNMNQNVRTDSGPTFANVYASGWFRNYGNQGIYNESYGTHFYSNGSGDWSITGSGAGVALAFRSNHQSTIRGYVHGDTSNQIGFLNNGGGWALRTNSSNNAFIHGTDLTINADNSGSSNIFMNDGDEGMRQIHCNSNRIGFLTQGGSWGSWCYDDGAWGTDYAMYSPIYYDISNTNRYLDLNSTAADAMVISGGIHISRDNVTGNGIILADDGDIVDLNDAYCSMRFSYGVRIFSANRGGSPVHTLHSDGNAYFNTSAQTPIFLVTSHSDNTKGYRIYNTSNSSVSAMFTNSANALVIGAGAFDQVQLNKKVLVNGAALGVNVAASATAGRIDASNDIVAYSSSDERLKHNITPIENALDKVKSLTGVEFDWKPEYKHAHGYEGHDTGIIAQQVQEVIPSAVRTNDTGFLAVRYEKLIGLLVEGMKEQQAQIEELKAKLDGVAR
jgi:hypothetical protein